MLLEFNLPNYYCCQCYKIGAISGTHGALPNIRAVRKESKMANGFTFCFTCHIQGSEFSTPAVGNENQPCLFLNMYLN